jgi:hypothetical protein
LTTRTVGTAGLGAGVSAVAASPWAVVGGTAWVEMVAGLSSLPAPWIST